MYCNATAITEKVQRYSNNQVNEKLGIIFLASRFAKKDLSIFQDFIIKAYWEKLVQPGQGFETTITLYLQDM